ncbi:unnamed protein product [Pleuronectes platessa]|uniref:Uncharacterized protein n=1 Tax=Pleuronectes platessa TaxID=8262 RepID=A0A9N7Z5V2_PLEPL|nr:unnamed protein product [Pleuronectes platessa]
MAAANKRAPAGGGVALTHRVTPDPHTQRANSFQRRNCPNLVLDISAGLQRNQNVLLTSPLHREEDKKPDEDLIIIETEAREESLIRWNPLQEFLSEGKRLTSIQPCPAPLGRETSAPLVLFHQSQRCFMITGFSPIAD